MEKLCIHCNHQMTKANLFTGEGFFDLEKNEKKLFKNRCKILVYVCPNCGHIDFFAEKPELFK